MIAKINGDRALALARDVLDIEADAVRALRDQLDDGFVGAVDFILGCRGRVVVSGIGKSGHVARKLAATLASTGTPAFFVHPAEASHGDLGMVTADDVFLALSNSGETEELVAILPLIKRLGAKLIAMTGRPSSSLAQLADVHLNSAVAKEACPMNLAPTASTTAALALGDALAVAVLDARGFGRDDFARSHPGGALGRRLLTYVRDVMRTGDQVGKLLSHQLDLGIVRLPLPAGTGLETRLIERDYFVAALPATHPLARRKIIDLAELRGDNFVVFSRELIPSMHTKVLSACLEAGFYPSIAYEVLQVVSAIGIVAAGAAVALLPSNLMAVKPEGMVYRPLQGAAAQIPIDAAVAWRGWDENPALHSFLSILPAQGSV